MHGLRVLSFLSIKKKPAPAGDEEGLMIPAAIDSLTYFSMASLSQAEKGSRCDPAVGMYPAEGQWHNHIGGEEEERWLWPY